MVGEFNIPLAANAKSVRQFDDGLTRGMYFFLLDRKTSHWAEGFCVVCHHFTAFFYEMVQFHLVSSQWMTTTLIQAVQIP